MDSIGPQIKAKKMSAFHGRGLSSYIEPGSEEVKSKEISQRIIAKSTFPVSPQPLIQNEGDEFEHDSPNKMMQ